MRIEESRQAYIPEKDIPINRQRTNIKEADNTFNPPYRQNRRNECENKKTYIN